MPTRRQCANAIRALAIDAIEKSKSGHFQNGKIRRY